jgi:ABC-2 type transport system permease protein
LSLHAAPAPRQFGAVNWRGLWTLCRRDLSRSLKEYRYTVLGPVVSNLLFLAVFLIGLGDIEARFGGLPLAQFLAPGLAIFSVCERAFATASESLVFDKLERVISDTLMAPLTALELTIGYAAGAAATGLVAGAAVLASMLVFVDLPFSAAPIALLFAVLGAVLHSLLGVIVGLWAERWDHYAAGLTFLVIPLGFLSGTFFPVAALPELGESLVRSNPVFYVIDGFRFGCTGFSESSVAIGAGIAGATAIVLGSIAYRLFRTGYKIKP